MEWGGAEKWLLEAADFLKDEGQAVQLICNPHSKLAHEAKQYGLSVREINTAKLSFLLPRKNNELESAMQDAHAVIIGNQDDLKTGTFAAEKVGVKKIIYRRNSPQPLKDNGLNKKIFAKLTNVIAISQEVAKNLVLHTENWFPKDKISTLYNGFNLERLQHSYERHYTPKEGEVVLGSAGRFVEEKGHKDLLKVAKILSEHDFKYHLLIAGYGELESELKSMAKAYGIEQSVTFLGYEKDMPKFFNSIDYFIFPSHSEGCPNTLIEAMAYKKICFAYDVSSIPEVLDYTNGYLSQFGDVKEMASKIMGHVPGNQGENAYKTVEEKFDYQRNMRTLLDIIS